MLKASTISSSTTSTRGLKHGVLDENEVDCSRLGMSPYYYYLLLLLFSL